MESNIQIFEKAEFGSVRVILIDNEPWFVAKDVCKALDLGNVGQALSRVREKDCKPLKEANIISNDVDLDTANGGRSPMLVSESGLYDLVLGSRKQEALQFKYWIIDEVLPSIRKHGMYATAPTIESILANPDMFITLLQQYKEEHTERVRLEAINHQQAIENEALLDENTRLNDRLGFGETWKQVPAILYFNKYFDMRQNAVWRQLGVALTRLSNELGYDTMRVPDTRFPDGVKCYHVDVVDYFEQLLKDGEDTSQYIKDKWKRKNVPTEEN